MALYATAADEDRAWELAARNDFTLSPGIALDATPAVAYVNYDRWLVDCPECNNGILAAVGRPVWCCNCGNTSLDGLGRPVVWPEEREQIDTLLGVRPGPANRNWYPRETVDDLAQQNADNMPSGA